MFFCSAGYSGGHVSTVGSVLVTNLKTGRRFGGLDKAEVCVNLFTWREGAIVSCQCC